MFATSVMLTVRNSDVRTIERLARQGEIPVEAVPFLAVVHAAAREAHSAIGPGHSPLDAVFRAVPKAYRENWLAKKKMGQRKLSRG